MLKKLLISLRTLNEFSFSDIFIDGVKLLYASPKAAVSVNGLSSQILSLERGTKQGYPLSPLFALIIEPLAETIRVSDQVKGIQTNARTHKMSLYADDLLLFMKGSI